MQVANKTALFYALVLPALVFLIGFLKEAPLYLSAIAFLKVLTILSGALMILGIVKGAPSQLVSLHQLRGRIFLTCACTILASIALTLGHGRFPELAWWFGFCLLNALLYVLYFRFLCAQDAGVDV